MLLWNSIGGKNKILILYYFSDLKRGKRDKKQSLLLNHFRALYMDEVLCIALCNADLTYTLARSWIHGQGYKKRENIRDQRVRACMLGLPRCMLRFVLQSGNRAARYALPASFRALYYRFFDWALFERYTGRRCEWTQEIQMRAIRCFNRDFQKGRIENAIPRPRVFLSECENAKRDKSDNSYSGFLIRMLPLVETNRIPLLPLSLR